MHRPFPYETPQAGSLPPDFTQLPLPPHNTSASEHLIPSLFGDRKPPLPIPRCFYFLWGPVPIPVPRPLVYAAGPSPPLPSCRRDVRAGPHPARRRRGAPRWRTRSRCSRCRAAPRAGRPITAAPRPRGGTAGTGTARPARDGQGTAAAAASGRQVAAPEGWWWRRPGGGERGWAGLSRAVRSGAERRALLPAGRLRPPPARPRGAPRPPVPGQPPLPARS